MGLGLWVKHVRSFFLQRVILRKLAAVSPEHCVVLTYHRILPEVERTDSVEPGMYVTPTTLRKHIRFLKQYFDIISIKQAEQIIAGNGRKKFGKPGCVLTFDDGWQDFYIHAWPVLQEEDAPAVVYLPTALIGSKQGFWTDRLAMVLEKAGAGVIARQLGNKLSQGIAGSNGSTQQQLSCVIEILKEFPYSKIEKILAVCEQEAGISPDMGGRSFMTWGEVKDVFSAGLVAFGSHTVNHAILTTLSWDEVLEELRNSKDKLVKEQVLQAGSISFCYPNGNYTDEIARQVDDAGYSSAMTCDFGWNAVGEGRRCALKRISLHQDISSTDYLFAYRLIQSF